LGVVTGKSLVSCFLTDGVCASLPVGLVVPDKEPLNGCVWVCVVAYSGQGVGPATPKVAGSTAGLALGQVVHTHMTLSPSSIIWCRSRVGDALRLGR